MMLSSKKLRGAIAELLYEKFPSVRDGEDARVFFDNIDKMERPCFYVEISPQRERTWDMIISERSLSVDVQYFGTEDDDGNIARASIFDDDGNVVQEGLYEVADTLDAAFRPVFYVDDRAITINEAETTIVDEVLHYIFTLDFADAFTEAELPEDKSELMRKLGLFINKNGKEDTSIYDKYQTDKEDE